MEGLRGRNILSAGAGQVPFLPARQLLAFGAHLSGIERFEVTMRISEYSED